MSLIPGTKLDIAETMDGEAFTDVHPNATNGQRKTVMLKSGALLTAFRTRPAKITLAISESNGEKWKVLPDIFPDPPPKGMEVALNPALAIGRDGMVHMAFRAHSTATNYGLNWYARSQDGLDWSVPVQLKPANEQIYYHGYPVIGTEPNKEVYIAFDFIGNLYLLRSLDNGETWEAPTPLTLTGTENTRPSMVVDEEGIIYVAFVMYGWIYGVKGKEQGEHWQLRLIYGDKTHGGNHPSIALDRDRKPVVAYVASSEGVGPDLYRAIHVHRQTNNWPNMWNYTVVDSVYESIMVVLHPSVAVTKDNVVQVVYNRTMEQSGVLWALWGNDVVFSESAHWPDWTEPLQITKIENDEFGPQVWTNLYCQPDAPVNRGFLVLWGGKDEEADHAGLPWLARSFCSADFVP